jgi:hypothetical protein
MRLGPNLAAVAAFLILTGTLASQNDSNVRPPVTKGDLLIIQRADQILNSESVWDRHDTRECPDAAKTLSLYCALEKATKEVGKEFEHRGAVLQEARFVIDEIAPNRNYGHRLMDYNNDPTTRFSDIKRVIRLTQERVETRLKTESKDRK